MATVDSGGVSSRVRPIMAAIRTTGIPVMGNVPEEAKPVVPFVTLSRQAGAGAWTLAQQLAGRLNAEQGGEPPWTAWDRELVEKVALDHRISQELIEALEESSHSWLQDLFSGFSLSEQADQADEARVYHRVAATMRALAQAGRTVIVGRGGVLVTRNMPGGVHVRLVAPLEQRLRNMQRLLHLSKEQALAEVHVRDRNRELFYRRFWPGQPPSAELFTVTLNSALLNEEQMVSCIVALVRAVPVGAGARRA